jgi:hypothetical protein
MNPYSFLFVVEDQKNNEPDGSYCGHPNHKFEHTLSPRFVK